MDSLARFLEDLPSSGFSLDLLSSGLETVVSSRTNYLQFCAKPNVSNWKRRSVMERSIKTLNFLCRQLFIKMTILIINHRSR